MLIRMVIWANVDFSSGWTKTSFDARGNSQPRTPVRNNIILYVPDLKLSFFDLVVVQNQSDSKQK
jgi:hypothetical protein